MSLSLSNGLGASDERHPWLDTAGPTRAMAVVWAGAGVVMYAQVLGDLVHQWMTDEMYSYGFLVPVVSGYLVWLRRDRIRATATRPMPGVGYGVLILGVAMLLVGHAASVAAVEQLSLIPVLVGSVLILGGGPVLAALCLPIAYLLLMIPIWEVLTDRLHAPFQNFSAGIGLSLIQSAGIPVYRDGLYLALPNITLEVAKACSGVNYLIAVIAVGIPLAALFLQGWVRRICLLVFAVLIAVLANGLRVALIGVLAYYGVGGALHGPFHVLHGLFVSFVGFGALFVGVWVLSERPAPAASERSVADHRSHSLERSSVRARGIGAAQWGGLLVFVLVATLIHFFGVIEVAPAQELRRFPLEIGAWEGRDIAWSPGDPYRLPGLDHTVAREYQREDGPPVRLFVGYFERQRNGKELVSREARQLYERSETAQVALGSRGLQEVRWVATGDGDGTTRTMLVYWYDLHGATVTNPLIVQARLAWNALVHRRSNGALIAVAVPLTDGEDPTVARSYAIRLIEDSAPILEQWVSGPLN